jgi:hypothetical protein
MSHKSDNPWLNNQESTSLQWKEHLQEEEEDRKGGFESLL